MEQQPEGSPPRTPRQPSWSPITQLGSSDEGAQSGSSLISKSMSTSSGSSHGNGSNDEAPFSPSTGELITTLPWNPPNDNTSSSGSNNGQDDEMEWTSDNGYGYGYDSNDEPVFPNGDGSPSDHSLNGTQNGESNGTSSSSSEDLAHTSSSSDSNSTSSSSSSGSSQDSDDAPPSTGLIPVEGLEEELEAFFNEGDSGSTDSSSHSSLQGPSNSFHDGFSQGSDGDFSGPGLLTVEGLEAIWDEEAPNGTNGANGASRTPSPDEGPAADDEEYQSPTITVHETVEGSPPGTPRQPSYSPITQLSDNE